MALPADAGAFGRFGAALLPRRAMPLSALAGAIAPEIFAAFPNRFDALRLFGSSGALTNFMTYSEQFDGASWVNFFTTVVPDAAMGPDGNLTADRIVETADNGTHIRSQNVAGLTDNATYTFSVFVKPGERSWVKFTAFLKDNSQYFVYFDVANGVVGTASGAGSYAIKSFPNGYYRCSITVNVLSGAFTPNIGFRLATGNGVDSYLGDVTKGLYVLGSQLVVGSAAGTYIKTVAATVTIGDGYVSSVPDESANLGGYRSGNEWGALAVFGAMERTTIERVGEVCDAGTAIIESDGAGKLRFTAPSSQTPGPYVAVGDGMVGLLEDGENPGKALRVRRSGAVPPAASRSLKLLEQYNNAFGQDNVADAEHTSGASQYRALILKNMSAGSMDLRIYLAQLGTPRALTVGYAAAGAIAPTAAAGSFDDWPDSGFAENQNTGEVVYYASRTSTALAVGASGRDVYAEVGGGAAGTIGDTLYPISGLRIAREDPSAQPAGFLQTIAIESTAPGGRTWLHPNSVKDPAVLEIYGLASGNIVGLWLHRKVIAAASARALVMNSFVIDHFLWN